MNTNGQPISGQNEGTGSANLIEELDLMFQVYANEIREYRLNGTKGKHLIDDQMFDVMIKLLDKKDKIGKLNTQSEAEPQSEPQKILNLQDFVLKGNKK